MLRHYAPGMGLAGHLVLMRQLQCPHELVRALVKTLDLLGSAGMSLGAKTPNQDQARCGLDEAINAEGK